MNDISNLISQVRDLLDQIEEQTSSNEGEEQEAPASSTPDNKPQSGKIAATVAAMKKGMKY